MLRSLIDDVSLKCTLSLPVLSLLALPVEYLPEFADIEVKLVETDTEAESRELVVGVLA